MHRILKFVDKVCIYGSLVWIVLGFFIHFFKITWYMFFILTLLHYILHQRWINMLKLIGFWVLIRLLIIVLPVWAVQLMVIGMFIYILYYSNKWVKTNDNEIMHKAQLISAKTQLKLIRTLQKKGKIVNEELIKKLEAFINEKPKYT